MLIRTHTCGQIRESEIGQTVRLNGWVGSYRDHGKLVFIDLRDRFGITQLVFDPDDGVEQSMMDQSDKLRNEDVVAVEGVVRKRIGGENPKLITGKIEIFVTKLEVLAKTDNPPFLPDDPTADGKIKLPNEELRLTHRYIDLRRPSMQRILSLRHKLYQTTRRYFDENGFLEIETPILYKSTPEGAREFLVPSRHVPGTFYALPQSPQLFKQILMISGCDRYMQICRCFRDEDPRADRQAEFTQIDLELSFVRRDQVMEVMEGFIRCLWKEICDFDVPSIRRMPFREAMEDYGIDRPDTRYDLKIKDISDFAATVDFGVFKSALEKGRDRPKFNSNRGVVKALRVPGGAEKLTRKIIDGYSEFVKGFGAGGVAVVKIIKDEVGGPKLDTGVAKFLEPVKSEFLAAMNCVVGDTVIFVADTYSIATKAIGELRQKIARDMNMIPKPGAEGGPWNFIWVIDFPMFEKNKDTGKWVAMHHPFTSPNDDQMKLFLDADMNDDDAIESIVSAGYDVVLNGQEIAGGSVRIHDRSVQSKVFALLGLTPEQAKEKFSFLLEALSFGAPPHAGMAFGLDRLVMNFTGTDNIRDVIAFPKTQTGADLMTKAPGTVPQNQLKDVHVASIAPPTA